MKQPKFHPEMLWLVRPFYNKIGCFVQAKSYREAYELADLQSRSGEKLEYLNTVIEIEEEISEGRKQK